jgi:hypothetical protein
MANEVNLSQQPLPSKDNRKSDYLQKLRGNVSQSSVVIGMFAALGVVIALIWIMFALNWTKWLLVLLIPIGILLLFLLIQAGYNAQWTGFRGKALWSWMDLFIKLIGAFAIPLAVIGLLLSVAQFNTQQAENQAQALDQQRQTTLDTYFDRMSDLMLIYHLSASKPDDEVRALASARTATALRSLDGVRQGELIRFLWRAHLITGSQPIVQIFGVDMSGMTIVKNSNLIGINLTDDDLSRANLSYVDLSGASLGDTQFQNAYLNEDNLINAYLNGANLVGANLSGSSLYGANLKGANLSGADLEGARYNLKPIQKKDTQGNPLIVEPTQWPQGFNPQAAGATCVDC